MAAAVLASPVHAESKVTATLSFNRTDLGAGGLVNSMTFDPLVIDLDAEKIGGTASFDDGYGSISLTLDGTFDPETYAFKATFNGSGNWSYDGGDYRRIRFNGTMDGTPKAGYAKESLMWEGPISVHYSASSAQGATAPAAGSTHTSTFGLDAKGKLAPRAVAANAKITAKVARVSGDAQYLKGGKEPAIPLKAGTVLEQGDRLLTGFDTEVLLNVGATSTLRVFETTNLRIDEFLSEKNIEKTRLYLEVGRIAAKVNQNDSVRGDFSVTTPTANSAVRDSEMVVSFDKDKNLTTVYVTSDKAYVKGLNDQAEAEIPADQKVTVDASNTVGHPAAFTQSELPQTTLTSNNGGSTTGNLVLPGLAGVAAVVVVAGFLLWKRRAAGIRKRRAAGAS